MDLSLKDKVIVVTGGSRGIGAGIVKLLEEEGACPVIIDRCNKDSIMGTAFASPNEEGKPFYVQAELTKPEDCARAIKKVVDKFGRIDGLVNNAGVNDGVGLENGNYESFLASLHKNLVHYYLMAHHALPFLISTRGAIVNISSKTAETGQGNTSAYAASNGGRNALTREWAVELLKYGIRVNAVVVAECYTPLYETWIKGFSDPEAKLKSITEKIPLEKRMTRSEEIANMVVYLLSSRASHSTGQIIYVDGGYTHLDRAI